MRPNSLIAMSYAPELFEQEKAVTFLRKIERLLIVSQPTYEDLGVALLDPFDSMYENISGGKTNSRRYLWLIGPFIQAKLNFLDFDQSPRDLVKFIVPYLDALHHEDNLMNGLKDYNQGGS